MMAKAKKVEKKNNKNLITIVLLIIAGVVILGYTDNIGNVAKGDLAKLTVTKASSSTVTIKVDPGYYGVQTSYEIFDSHNRLVSNSRGVLCGANSLCKGSITKQIGIHQSWKENNPGVYTIRVYDINREKAGKSPYITATFNVPSV